MRSQGYVMQRTDEGDQCHPDHHDPFTTSQQLADRVSSERWWHTFSRISSISCLRCCMARLLGLACSANLALLAVYSCAQNTRVVEGRVSNLLREAHICWGEPSNRRPQPRTNRVSPARVGPNLIPLMMLEARWLTVRHKEQRLPGSINAAWSACCCTWVGPCLGGLAEVQVMCKLEKLCLAAWLMQVQTRIAGPTWRDPSCTG